MEQKLCMRICERKEWQDFVQSTIKLRIKLINKNEFMHLSNYSINKHSDEYVKNSKESGSEATKRKLSDIYQSLINDNPNGAEIVK